MPFNKEHAQFPYDEFTQQVDYTVDEGLLQVPVAGPAGTPCEIVRLHGGKGQRTLSFAAQRTGALPELPTPVPQSANEVLAGLNIKPAVPSLMADGNAVTRVEGQYVHFLLTPLDHTKILPMGSAPYDTNTGSTYLLTPNYFTVHGVPVTPKNPPQTPPANLMFGIIGG